MMKKILGLLTIFSFVLVLNGAINVETKKIKPGINPSPNKNGINSNQWNLKQGRNDEEKLQSAPDRILVKYKKQDTLRVQEAIRASIETVYGIQSIRYFPFIDVYLYKTSLDKDKTLEKLSKNPNIEYAEPDYYVYIDSKIPNDPNFKEQWGLHNTGQTGGTVDADIDAPEAWDLTTGSSDVVVAVIDTGVDYNHEDLNANIWKNPGEISNNGIDDDGNGYVDDLLGLNAITDSGDPMDDNGHGTHVAGIIAAVGNNDIGVVGVCWNAKIMVLKFANEEGKGAISDEIKCIEYAINKGAYIMNASFGSPWQSFFEKDAIEAAEEAGVLFIASAGNDGTNNDSEIPHYPASYTFANIISVTSINELDTLEFNYGPYSIDVAAPGINIFSTLPNNNYGYLSGTSMSAPYVSGLAALIKSYYPNVDWKQTKGRILIGVEKTTSLVGKILTEGRIDAYNSLTSGDVASYTLNIQSSPSTEAHIEVSPNDINNHGDGYTSFSRVYAPFTTVNLTAPSVHDGKNFFYWSMGDYVYSFDRTTLLMLDYNVAITADYSDRFQWRFYGGYLGPRNRRFTQINTSPAIGTDGTIYLNYAHTLYAINPDGTKKWDFNYATIDFSWYSSPTIGSDGTIYFGANTALYAIYPDGTEKWRFRAGDYIYPSPAIGSDGTIYFGSDDNYFYALDSSGNLKWKFKTDAKVRASPAIGTDDTIYFGSRDSYFYALDSSGNLKWKFKTTGDTNLIQYYVSPAIGSDGTIYFGDANDFFYALDPLGNLKWKYKPLGSVFTSPAIGLDGTIYFGGSSCDETITALDPNGNLKWIYSANHSISSSPAIGNDGTIYFGGTNSYFYALDSTGRLKWKVPLGNEIDNSSPTISSDGTIYISAYDGYLYAFKTDSQGLANSPWPKFQRDIRNTGRAPNSYNLSISSSLGGTTTPSPGNYSYYEGVNVAITAIPDTGYFFYKWSGDIPSGHETDNPISILMNTNKTITATFVDSSLPFISLSSSTFNFGTTTQGNKTQDQQFIISNKGGGTLEWSISDNAGWLSCSPASGTGNAVITVSVDPSGLAAGTYNGTITVSSANATNSPQAINVTLTVYGEGTSSDPFGVFSTPVDGSTVSSSIPVTGWALDDIGVESVKIFREEGGALVYLGDAMFVEGTRVDIEKVYPEYPLCNKAGWGYMMLTNFLPNGGNGTFTIYAVATDKEGNGVTLGASTIYVDNANAVKPFGAIDTPTQGGTASGSSFINWGWALTPMPNSIPTDGSTIDVYVDSVNLGHPVYNNYREDIANNFPGYANSDGAVGYFYLDTTGYADGLHSIAWIAEDNAGNADGIGSRYFTISNTGSSINAQVRGRSQRKALDIPLSFESIMNLPINYDPISYKRGFKTDIDPEIAVIDNYGITSIEIREVERLEVDLGEGTSYRGYLVVGNQLRPLPIGSTLDTENGVFYWQPGPGFIGEYEFVFIKQDKSGSQSKIRVKIRIAPKFAIY